MLQTIAELRRRLDTRAEPRRAERATPPRASRSEPATSPSDAAAGLPPIPAAFATKARAGKPQRNPRVRSRPGF